MSDKPLPFVVNDRRKFTSEGELRPDADPSPKVESEAPTVAVPPAPEPIQAAPAPPAEPSASEPTADPDSDIPPPPTPEQIEQARQAYVATADRLDLAIRAANPGMDHPPDMTFEQLVQSLYMQSILQMGGGTQKGQQPQVDILGARQSIDMLGILAEKTVGNLAASEQNLLDSALFELRLAFLEVTQALARSAQSRAGQPPLAPGMPGAPPSGPRIVR